METMKPQLTSEDRHRPARCYPFTDAWRKALELPDDAVVSEVLASAVMVQSMCGVMPAVRIVLRVRFTSDEISVQEAADAIGDPPEDWRQMFADALPEIAGDQGDA